MKTTWLWLPLACLIPVLGTFLPGCEDNSGTEDNSTPSDIQSLSVKPATTTIPSTNSYATFTASGGTPPYTWTVSDTTLGAIPDIHASSVTYTRVDGAGGVNVITVSDNNHWVAQATVYQE